MYVGTSIKRVEDRRLLTGCGRYVDDIPARDTCWAAFVRSPHAHAQIVSIDASAATKKPGVQKILTAADWTAAGFGVLPCIARIPSSDGRPMNEFTRPALADSRVRHVGDTVVAVIADSRERAEAAAATVEIAYEPLPGVTDVARSLDAGAPVLHETAGTNLAFDMALGDSHAVDEAMAAAAHVTELELTNNRIAANSIEPRAYLAAYDETADRYTLWASNQTPHLLRRWIAEHSLFIPEHKLRVVAPDVGGGFGMKVYHYPEEVIVLWASGLLGRPVRWTGTRSEALMTDTQGRDHATFCRLGLDDKGRIVALDVDTIGSLGAYVTAFGGLITGAAYPRVLTGLYRIPNAHCRIRAVYTNATPIGAYRGAGRPEGIYVLERLLETAAHEMGIDVTDLRARNLIQPDGLPHDTALGLKLDSGDFPGLLEKIKAQAGYDALRAEQRNRRRDGDPLIGVGLSAYIDRAGVGPTRTGDKTIGEFGSWESASIRVHPSAKVTVASGNHSHGQGYETVFAQLVADRLQLELDDIEIVEGDTDRVAYGHGTWGSRSAVVGGHAILRAADRIIDKGKTLAAHILECAPADVAYEDGHFVVGGTDRRLTFATVAKAAYHGGDYPDDFELGLDETAFFDPIAFTYPAGVQLCVVLVDPETGEVHLRDYHAVDDVGTRLNPMIVEGQLHGGIVQGLGQALMENVSHDAETGQLLSGSYMDYAMPRAADLPMLQLAALDTLAPSNLLGVKGIGESGTIGAPATVVNAVVDALWHLGVRHIDMPLTAERVWRAIRDARGERTRN